VNSWTNVGNKNRLNSCLDAESPLNLSLRSPNYDYDIETPLNQGLGLTWSPS